MKIPSRPNINRRRANNPVDTSACLLAHASQGETEPRPWAREREGEIFFTNERRRSASTIDSTLDSGLNATLCLPERRELRLPSVNTSARIFHSRRNGGTPLSRHESGALHRASILLYRSHGLPSSAFVQRCRRPLPATFLEPFPIASVSCVSFHSWNLVFSEISEIVSDASISRSTMNVGNRYR